MLFVKCKTSDTYIRMKLNIHLFYKENALNLIEEYKVILWRGILIICFLLTWERIFCVAREHVFSYQLAGYLINQTEILLAEVFSKSGIHLLQGQVKSRESEFKTLIYVS